MKCPHCLIHFHGVFPASNFFANSNEPVITGGVSKLTSIFWFTQQTTCPSCQRLVLFLLQSRDRDANHAFSRWMVYPRAYSKGAIPQEVLEVFAKDYSEACLILSDSPNASAALGRRCLQNLLREAAGGNKGNLFDEIQQIIDLKTLPSHLSEAIDSVRALGNFAAHPIKSTNSGQIVDVEAGEAEWLLDTLEGLFDFYFVQPAILLKKRDDLNKKLTEAGKTPLK